MKQPLSFNITADPDFIATKVKRFGSGSNHLICATTKLDSYFNKIDREEEHLSANIPFPARTLLGQSPPPETQGYRKITPTGKEKIPFL